MYRHLFSINQNHTTDVFDGSNYKTLHKSHVEKNKVTNILKILIRTLNGRVCTFQEVQTYLL